MKVFVPDAPTRQTGDGIKKSDPAILSVLLKLAEGRHYTPAGQLVDLNGEVIPETNISKLVAYAMKPEHRLEGLKEFASVLEAAGLTDIPNEYVLEMMDQHMEFFTPPPNSPPSSRREPVIREQRRSASQPPSAQASADTATTSHVPLIERRSISPQPGPSSRPEPQSRRLRNNAPLVPPPSPPPEQQLPSLPTTPQKQPTKRKRPTKNAAAKALKRAKTTGTSPWQLRSRQ